MSISTLASRARPAGGRAASAKAKTVAAAMVAMQVLEPRLLLAVPTLWTTHGPGGGGSYFSAAISGQRLWVASDMSGIYQSADFGQHWQIQNFHNNGASGGIRGGSASQVSFTSDPNILYIPNSSLGVAKSTSGGATWSKLTGWTNGTAYWSAADPTSSSKILIANANNLYVSSNGGTSFSSAYASSGLYVAGALFDGSNVYVGTNKGLLVSTDGGTSFALHSAQLAAGQYMISFAGAKEGATTRLLAVTSTTNPNVANSNGTSARSYPYSKFYRLDVGGTWTDKSAAVSAVASGETPKFVQMARGNISVAYLAGADAAGRPQVLKTSNGGDAFADSFFTRTVDGGGIPNKNTHTAYSGQGGDFDWSWGGTPWSFVADVNDPNRAFLANSGFLHVTSDGGATWHQADVNPADENPAGQVTPKHKPYRGAGGDDTSVHYLTWMGPNTIMAGYTDTTGWRSTDGGTSWAYPQWNGVADNTIYKTDLAPDGKLYAAASNVHDMYQSNYLLDTRTNPSWQNGRVIVSNDQGATWSLIHEFGHPVVWIERDPGNAQRLYAMVVDGIGSPDAGAFGGVWVTNNLNAGAASTWTKLANPPRTEGHPYYLRVLDDGTLVATYSGRRAIVDGAEKFTASSGVFVSTDGGATWLDRTHTSMRWYTKGITIDPTDPAQNTWYAAVCNGWSGTGNDLGDVYRTTNRGQTWTKMNLQNVLGVLSMGINSVTINATTKEMFVATEVRGLFYAPDVTVANFAWSHFQDVTSFPFSWVERTFNNPYDAKDVWVATFGGGLKRGGAAPGGLNASGASASQINLTWSDNSGNEAGFEIDRATDAAFTQNLVTTSAAMNATSASIIGLNAATTYYFRIRAINGPNKSANSTTASATTSPAVNPNPVINGGAGADTFYLRRSGAMIEVFNSATPVGSPVFSAAFADLQSISFATDGGDDALIIDSAGGTPIPGNGLAYDGGAGSNALSAPAGAAGGSIALSGGSFALAGSGGTIVLGDLSIDPSAQLDVGDNDLVIDYASVSPIGNWTGSSYDGISGWIKEGRIVSSAASGNVRALGVAEARDARGISGSQTSTFGGQTVDSTSVLVKFTWGGDANLDGKINIDDYGRIDGNVALSGVVFGWFNGDFNLDGKINIDDYGIIDGNINQQDQVL